MSILEAISPTARRLLTISGGGRMNFITKSSASGRSLRVHVKLSYNKTLCGLLLDPLQLDIGPMNCKRCAACQRRLAAGRSYRPRSNIRLNGKRISVKQNTFEK